MTGFLGSLTTFSAFSLELFMTLQSGKFLLALGIMIAHVFGSLLMTVSGYMTGVYFKWLFFNEKKYIPAIIRVIHPTNNRIPPNGINCEKLFILKNILI